MEKKRAESSKSQEELNVLYYTNHHLNFVRSASQVGPAALVHCTVCQDELPNCDCGCGSTILQRRPVKPKASKRRLGRRRIF